MGKESNYIFIYKKILDARKRCKYSELKRRPEDKRSVPRRSIPTNILIKLLNLCPFGEGNIYENLTFDAMKAILKGIVDWDLAHQQFSSEGGRGDIELPFCTEMLPEYPRWKPWYYQYEIKSIIVEAKNMKSEAAPDDVGQIKRYLDTSKKGRFGMLVSRKGFSKNAMKTLRAYTRDNYLILPLDHDDLERLLKLSMDNSLKVMRYLRRKETLLLRIT